MKTVDELYYEVVANEELKAAFAAAAKENKLAEFLKAQGCDATAEEAAEFLEARQSAEGELSDDELDAVCGTGSYYHECLRLSARTRAFRGCDAF